MSTKNTLPPEDDPTFSHVWKTLSAIDCKEHIQKKNGLSFLSWAWAWGIMMENYPFAQYEFAEPEVDAKGTVTVWVTVSICNLRRTMWLPVMDYKNKAIVNPDARDVSDSRMRCLVKCLAMYGLGHYIYAGEDVPKEVEASEPQETPKTKARKWGEKKATEPAPDKSVTTDGVDTPDDGIDIRDAESAENVVKFMCDAVDGFHSDSKESLVNFWNSNKAIIDFLDQNYGEQFNTLKAHFSATRKKIESKESK